ncbi:hypothetical protein JL193_10560 [Polaribacter batillariae]|uniref:Uncharacterized protein n=1 Tax=Polaribacter batillariae TaxID=2808900 RepID=A0ABX7SUR1_9FLAO|nr:hypothetical protein [Polaribacter batillariae]QTD36584.1 hypothetical protein JL193_10560 [Polaribacter batillariae]
MKNRMKYLFLVLFASLCVVSCDNDDKNPETTKNFVKHNVKFSVKTTNNGVGIINFSSRASGLNQADGSYSGVNVGNVSESYAFEYEAGSNIENSLSFTALDENIPFSVTLVIEVDGKVVEERTQLINNNGQIVQINHAFKAKDDGTNATEVNQNLVSTTVKFDVASSTNDSAGIIRFKGSADNGSKQKRLYVGTNLNGTSGQHTFNVNKGEDVDLELAYTHLSGKMPYDITVTFTVDGKEVTTVTETITDSNTEVNLDYEYNP